MSRHPFYENKPDWPDDYDVRRTLLECLSLLGMTSLASCDECRTLDVAEVLKGKVNELAHRNAGLLTENAQFKDALKAQDELTALRAKAVAALEKFAGHEFKCDIEMVLNLRKCSCGLDEALAELRGVEGGK